MNPDNTLEIGWEHHNGTLDVWVKAGNATPLHWDNFDDALEAVHGAFRKLGLARLRLETGN